MNKQQYIFQFIQDYDNGRLKGIVRGLSTKSNKQEISNLINELQLLESLIADYEMQIIGSNNKILYSMHMFEILKDWIDKDKFTKKHSIINFADVAIKKLTI